MALEACGTSKQPFIVASSCLGNEGPTKGTRCACERCGVPVGHRSPSPPLHGCPVRRDPYCVSSVHVPVNRRPGGCTDACHVGRCLTHRYRTTNQRIQDAAKEGGAGDTNHASLPVLSMVDVEDFVAATVCEVLIAASRTMTGGDSFNTINSLFGRGQLLCIMADTKPMPPIDITVDTRGSMLVEIDTVNTYRACHVDVMGDGDPQVRTCSLSQRLRPVHCSQTWACPGMGIDQNERTRAHGVTVAACQSRCGRRYAKCRCGDGWAQFSSSCAHVSTRRPERECRSCVRKWRWRWRWCRCRCRCWCCRHRCGWCWCCHWLAS